MKRILSMILILSLLAASAMPVLGADELPPAQENVQTSQEDEAAPPDVLPAPESDTLEGDESDPDVNDNVPDDPATDDVTNDPAPEDPSEALELPAEEEIPEEPAKEPVTTYEEEDAALSEGYYSLRTVINSAYALDIESGSPIRCANAQLYQANNTAAQTFHIVSAGTKDESPLYTIETTHAKGMALDVSGGTAANKTNLQMYTSNKTVAQKWLIKEIIEVVTDAEGQETRTPTGKYVFRSALDPAFVIDVSGGKVANKQNVQLYTANNTTAQQWTLVSMPEPELPKIEKPYDSGGIYRIVPKLNSGMSVDIRSGSLASKALVQLYKNNNTNAQKFVIRDTADGFATIQAAQSGLVLNVKSAKETNKQPVWQYRNDGTKACKWTIEPTGDADGSVYIRYADTNFMLDVPNGSATSKKALYIYRQNGTDAQKFYLVPTNYKTGWQNYMGKERYVYDAFGHYYTNRTVDGRKVGADGTEKKEDKRLRLALEKVYKSSGRSLRGVFNWCVNNIAISGDDKTVAKGYNNIAWWAIVGIENKYGHCYNHAAAFYHLAKDLGYNAHWVLGRIGGASRSYGHAWVEIDMDGGTYVFDTYFQRVYKRNGYHFTYGASGTYRYFNYKRQN